MLQKVSLSGVIGFLEVMKLKVRLRQRHFRCIPFLLLLLTHTWSVGALEEQPDDKWMHIGCNDTSSVQMVKVKFSSQVVRNGKDYLHSKCLCLQFIDRYEFSQKKIRSQNYVLHFTVSS